MCCKIMRYIYVTLRKRNNIKQPLFFGNTKAKGCHVYLKYVGATNVECKSPPICHGNIQYHTFDCIGTPRKKNPSLLWDYCEFANDVRSCNRCAWSFSNLAYAEMDMLISCLIAACVYNLAFLMHCQELPTKIIILPLDSWDLICWRMHIHSYHTLWIRST